MAVYPLAVRKLIPVPADGRDPRITPRVVILHVAVSEQPSLHDYFDGPSGGVESHFYVRRDGTVEQYRSTDVQADANTDANGFAISIETQGLEHGEWTPEQIRCLKELILWCHNTHGIPLVKCAKWDGSGIGYHTLFRGSWDKRQASCPGPDRIRQFNNVLVPWLASGGDEDDMPYTEDELRKIVREAVNAELEQRDVAAPMLGKDATQSVKEALDRIGRWALASRENAASALAVAKAQAAAATPLTVAQIEAAAKAGAKAALDEEIDSATVTLNTTK